MGINLVVAVTDGDWFELLRQAPNLSEVNFWAPSAANFRALQPGELFLFKLHAPRNVIVGGGIFAYEHVAMLAGLGSLRRGEWSHLSPTDARADCSVSKGPRARSK